ncbi:kinase-like domain-containing protein [Annulohypoxylon moriforme]|nr:kinase-like domain-containing protein [Annulohypoxylon moriforme]
MENNPQGVDWSSRMEKIATGLQVNEVQPVKYKILKPIGSGATGSVYKCENQDGELMAVKKVKHKQSDYTFNIFHEVRVHKSLRHPNIVEIFHHQYDYQSSSLEIFLALKEGSLASLLSTKAPLTFRKDFKFVNDYLKQMLQALDYLSSENVFHRDIKPANILYVMDPKKKPFFQLADFGLAHAFDSGETLSKNCAGTAGYMAPEVEHKMIKEDQTHKADVWSLFMTLVWIVDVNDFRARSKLTLNFAQCVEIATKAAKSRLNLYFPMAEVRPEARASAAQMLVLMYEGEGLSTVRNQIPPLKTT